MKSHNETLKEKSERKQVKRYQINMQCHTIFKGNFMYEYRLHHAYGTFVVFYMFCVLKNNFDLNVNYKLKILIIYMIYNLCTVV